MPPPLALLLLLLGQRTAGGGGCPCQSHPGRTYCPLDKTPGQCDKPSHPPCEPGGACPAPPPGPPECTSVKLVKQESHSKCVEGKNFGCNATGNSMWEDGCRGYFSCGGGPSFECSVDGPGRHTCPCTGLPPPSPPGTPAFHGCTAPAAVRLPYCNTSLSREARLDDLVSRLSQAEKVGLLTPQDPRADCGGLMGGAAEIGLPPWHWLTEANTNAAVNCIGPGKCATLFVGPEGMAASFNRSRWARPLASVFSPWTACLTPVALSQLAPQGECAGLRIPCLQFPRRRACAHGLRPEH